MSPPIKAVVVQRFAVPAECVFEAWLDPELISRWMFGPDVCDERIIRLDVEPYTGGKFSFVVERHGVEVDHVGKYLELDRPGLLVFTWGTRDSLRNTGRVIVEILPCVGGCDLTLTHVMSAERAAFVDQTARSWRKMFGTLAAALAEKNPLTLNPS